VIDKVSVACEDVRTAYRPFAKEKGKTVTDALVTKVVLGTMGCFPALDTYFNAGWKHRGFSVLGGLSSAFIQNMLRFCRNNLQDFQAEQARIEQMYQMRCPLMKLVDAYFHQIGWEIEAEKPKAEKKKATLKAMKGDSL
jgi:hypothetical protein